MAAIGLAAGRCPMSDSTLVCLMALDENGGKTSLRFFQPWDIQNVEAWQVTTDGQEFAGSRLTVSRGGDDVTVYSVLPPGAVARRIDDARRAISDESSMRVQPVRVTNWMSQVWVLLLVQMLGQIALYRIWVKVGDCLIWYRDALACDVSRWWLP